MFSSNSESKLVNSKIRFADALMSRGSPRDRAEAIVQLDQARERCEPGSSIRILIDRHAAYGMTLGGDTTRAVALSRDAFDRAQNAYDESSWRVADLESVLGGALLADGRAVEAKRLLESSWQSLCSDPTSRKNARRQAAARVRLLDSSIDADPETCPHLGEAVSSDR